LKTGSGGQFDVAVDGTVIFSKWDEGRFPEPAEIIAALERLPNQTG
jgi:selT/selW/selH-like putative selenoprotein